MVDNMKTDLPRLRGVGLGRNTRYQVVEDSNLSAAAGLERDIEVLAGDLGGHFQRLQAGDRRTIFVRVEDEIHDGGEERDD